MSCILKLKQIYEDLTEVDKKIADYILNNTEAISKLSVSELASNSKTSTASIVRFSRKMGYSGFGDLKIEIAKDLMGKEDIAIAISYSGESKEVIKSIENAKLKGCKVICITKYSDNHLSKISDLKLVVPNIEKRLREGAISSRIAMLTLIDIIYISIIQENLNEAEQKLQETKRILDYLNINNA